MRHAGTVTPAASCAGMPASCAGEMCGSSAAARSSAVTGAIPPVKQVAKLMAQVGARGQVTFGGRLESTARGFPASAMAKKSAGDWRDRAQVHTWAASVASELGCP